MEIDLIESFVLLSIHDKKAYLNISNFSYGFAGAVLLELAITGKIMSDGSRIIAKDKKNMPDKTRDTVMNIIRKTGKIPRLIMRISYKVPSLKKEVMKNLERKRIIRIERKFFIRLIPYKRYRILNRQLKKSMMNQLSDVVNGHKPDRKLLMLCATVYSCGLIPFIFKKNYKNLAREKFGELVKNERSDKDIMELAIQIRKVILSASKTQI